MLVFIHKIKNLNSAFYTIKIYRVCTVTGILERSCYIGYNFTEYEYYRKVNGDE